MNPTTPEAEENLKSCLSADIQPKSHLSSGVWRQPKDGKEWGEEYVTKDHPDKLKDAGQGRHSSLENVLCETSLAGKSREEITGWNCAEQETYRLESLEYRFRGQMRPLSLQLPFQMNAKDYGGGGTHLRSHGQLGTSTSNLGIHDF